MELEECPKAGMMHYATPKNGLATNVMDKQQVSFWHTNCVR
jgi:hypothetical protein